MPLSSRLPEMTPLKRLITFCFVSEFPVAMGRTIPSITFRIDREIAGLKKFFDTLDIDEKEAFQELVSHAKRMRSAAMEVNGELFHLILLTMLIGIKKEMKRMKNADSRPFAKF